MASNKFKMFFIVTNNKSLLLVFKVLFRTCYVLELYGVPVYGREVSTIGCIYIYYTLCSILLLSFLCSDVTRTLLLDRQDTMQVSYTWPLCGLEKWIKNSVPYFSPYRSEDIRNLV